MARYLNGIYENNYDLGCLWILGYTEYHHSYIKGRVTQNVSISLRDKYDVVSPAYPLRSSIAVLTYT